MLGTHEMSSSPSYTQAPGTPQVFLGWKYWTVNRLPLLLGIPKAFLFLKCQVHKRWKKCIFTLFTSGNGYFLFLLEICYPSVYHYSRQSIQERNIVHRVPIDHFRSLAKATSLNLDASRKEAAGSHAWDFHRAPVSQPATASVTPLPSYSLSRFSFAVLAKAGSSWVDPA